MAAQFKGKEQRAACYRARDEYFECADKLAKGTDGMVACKRAYELFEKSCGPKWTEHFIRRRDYLKFKSKLETEGFEPFDSDKIEKKSKT